MKFKIYRCIYLDRKAHIKWEIFGRTIEFADSLANRMSNIGLYKLKRARIGFCKLVYTEWPPYELEQAQVEYVERIENKHRDSLTS